MKRRGLCLLLCVLCVLTAWGAKPPKRGTATLYSPIKYKDDFSRASFDFQSGHMGTKQSSDVVYGAMYTGEDHDWFTPSRIADNRHTIRDLGALTWDKKIKVPVVPPMPELRPGETRHLTVDTSAGVYEKWAMDVEEKGLWARAIVGHMYVLHAKNAKSDFYVLFRVESIERGDNCTISWRRVRSPKG